MSACISQHGEYSSHELDNLHTCTMCGVLDEDALRAELAEQRDRAEAAINLHANAEHLLAGRDNTIAELGASNARLNEENERLRERMYGLELWRRLVSDLDRCPHGRHEGDTCAGWRGPGLYDGGCRDGISLGNPLLGGMAVLGVGLDGAQLIRVPEERADRVNAASWYTPAEPGEMLHHHLPGYVGEEEAAKVGLGETGKAAGEEISIGTEPDEFGDSWCCEPCKRIAQAANPMRGHCDSCGAPKTRDCACGRFLCDSCQCDCAEAAPAGLGGTAHDCEEAG